MRASNLLRSFARGAIDLVLPNHCLACGIPQSESAPVCESCRDRFTFIQPPRCEKCGQAVGEYSTYERRCADCQRHPLAFQQATAPLLHASVVRDLMLQLKFARVSIVADLFADLLADHLAEMPWMSDIDLFQPVPMHWWRRLRRGYDQAERLAAGTARLFGVPVGRALQKVRNTRPQSRLSRSSRLENLRGAFRVPRPEEVEGKTILLIDDVMTTGTTCSECARILEEAGAVRVFALTVARAGWR